jgi:hypothetical protein
MTGFRYMEVLLFDPLVCVGLFMLSIFVFSLWLAKYPSRKTLMTPRLLNEIWKARHRLRGVPLPMNLYQIEEFKAFLNRRIDERLRMEFLAGAEWGWSEAGPMVKFSIDDANFTLRRVTEGCELTSEKGGKAYSAILLADGPEPEFSDQLLVALGEVLAPL